MKAARLRSIAFLCLSATISGFGADSSTLAPNLASAPGEKGWKFFNRAAHPLDKDGAPAVRLEGRGGTGLVRLEGVDFGNGTIEVDLRGKNVLQQSFLGIAFHGADAQTYDAIYFRPFNFKAPEPRRLRAVQYISHPTNTWEKLRTEHPGTYEKPVSPVPAPDGWFHVRIVVASPRISVFVDGAVAPCLVVDQLSERKHGWIALWTDVSGGDFANLSITPATH
jgi:hypothetical protein